jgi:hypothetical protein
MRMRARDSLQMRWRWPPESCELVTLAPAIVL